jgi:hypothetical protein
MRDNERLGRIDRGSKRHIECRCIPAGNACLQACKNSRIELDDGPLDNAVRSSAIRGLSDEP